MTLQQKYLGDGNQEGTRFHEGYKHGIESVMRFLDGWDSEGEREGGLMWDIREALREGIL